MAEIPALISIDCHQCNQHVFVPVTINDRSEITDTDGLDEITLTVAAPGLHSHLVQHMDYQ
jgi:hypothetical protein